jgi:hypothetical protein
MTQNFPVRLHASIPLRCLLQQRASDNHLRANISVFYFPANLQSGGAAADSLAVEVRAKSGFRTTNKTL